MSVKTLDFGQELPSSTGLFFRVKNKGDQIKFRIAQPPVYTAKHFVKKENNWDVTECPRVMNDDECDLCIQFFKLKAQSKKLKDTDPKESERLNNEARNYGPSTEFYFPVLNRDSKKFTILQTTQGVRDRLNEQHAAGVNVISKDFILTNTGKVGKEKYSLIAVDSADTAEFDEEEKKEYEKALSYDLSLVSNSGQDEGIEE